MYVYTYIYIHIFMCNFLLDPLDPARRRGQGRPGHHQYICIYIHVYMYIYICTYIHTYTYIHIFICNVLFDPLDPARRRGQGCPGQPERWRTRSRAEAEGSEPVNPKPTC